MHCVVSAIGLTLCSLCPYIGLLLPRGTCIHCHAQHIHTTVQTKHVWRKQERITLYSLLYSSSKFLSTHSYRIFLNGEVCNKEPIPSPILYLPLSYIGFVLSAAHFAHTLFSSHSVVEHACLACMLVCTPYVYKWAYLTHFVQLTQCS